MTTFGFLFSPMELWSQVIDEAEVDSSEALSLPYAYYLDGEIQPWTLGDLDENLADTLLTSLQNAGFLFAEYQRETVEEESGQTRFHFKKGIRVEVGKMEILGLSSLSLENATALFNTRGGELLNRTVLEQDIDLLLQQLDLKGKVLSRAFINKLELVESDPWRIDVEIVVDEGRDLTLNKIEIEDQARTRSGYLARVLGYRPDRPIQTFDAEEIRRRLMETKVFRSVDQVALSVDENEKAVMRIKAKEEPPGVFDVILGYLPSATPDGGGSLVGNINVQMLHFLGAGRSFGFKMDRLPGSVSRLDVEASDPYVAGSPFRLAAGFKGFQQDSTYSTRRYRFEGGYRLLSGVESFVSLSREIANPNPIVNSDVQDAASFFLGIGFSFSRLDFPLVPRNGFEFLTNVEQGRKVRNLSRPTDSGGTEFFDDVLQQTRLSLFARFYRPLRQRQVLAIGFDGFALQSREYDQSDLFRLGGAKSLRGYNEEQYRGNISSRTFVEWRYLLERTSYFFLFTDLGFVSIPNTGGIIDQAEVTREILPGYGFGILFGTAAGQFAISLALNPDEGLGSKVHLGMTLGL